MAGADTIITEVAIQGQEDVISAFEAIGRAGADAFGAIEKALVDTSAVITGVLLAVGGIGVALEEWARHSAQATVEMQNLATASGLTISQMSALKGTLESLGTDTGFLESAFRRTALIIETTWQEITKQVKESRNQIVNDQLAIKQSALGVEGAENAVFQARTKLAELRGSPLSPEIQARQQLKEAVLAQEQAELALAQAQQKQKETQEKAIEDQRNSIASVTAAVKSVVDGLQTVGQASKDANLEINNVIKGLVAGAGPAGEAGAAGLKDFTGSMEDISSQAPEVQAVFFNLADFMKNSGNAAQNTALAYRFFGRNVRQDVIAAMSEGSEAIKKNMKSLEDLGIVLKDNKAAEEFQRSFGALSFTVRTTLQQIGNLFGPTFSAGFEKLTSTIQQNHSKILEWAGTIANNVTPVITAFFKLLTGEALGDEDPNWIKTLVKAGKTVLDFFIGPVADAIKGLFQALAGEEVKTPWVNTVIEGVKGLLSFFGTAADIIGAFSDVISAVFNTLAEVINEITGTDLKGAEVALATLGLAALALVVAFNPVLGAIVAVTAAVAALQATINKSTDKKIQATSLEVDQLIKEREAMIKALADAGKISDEEKKALTDGIRELRDNLSAAIKDRDPAGLRVLSDSIREENEKIRAVDQETAANGVKVWRDANEKIGETFSARAARMRAEDAKTMAELKAAADRLGKPSGEKEIGDEADGVDQKIKKLQDRIADLKSGKPVDSGVNKIGEDADTVDQKIKKLQDRIADLKAGKVAPTLDTTQLDQKAEQAKKTAETTGKSIGDSITKGAQEGVDGAAKAFELLDGKLKELKGPKTAKPQDRGIRAVGGEDEIEGLQKKIEGLKTTALDLEKQLTAGLEKGLDVSRLQKQIQDIGGSIDDLGRQLETKTNERFKAFSEDPSRKLDPLEKTIDTLKGKAVDLEKQLVSGLEKGLDVSRIQKQIEDINSEVDRIGVQLERKLASKKQPLTDADKEPIEREKVELPPPDTAKFNEALSKLDEGQKSLLEKIKETWKPPPIDPSIWNIPNLRDDIEQQLVEKYKKIQEMWATSPINLASWNISTQPIDNVATTSDADYQKVKTTWAIPAVDISQWLGSTGSNFGQIVQQGQSAYEQLKAIFSVPLEVKAQFSQGGQNGGGFAEGGLFRGLPGIDTNLAWLSDWEWVMNPMATKGWGTQFMHMVNQMDVQGVADWVHRMKAPGFAHGGLVDWSHSINVPNFSTTGLVNWLHNLQGFAAGGLADRWSNTSGPSFDSFSRVTVEGASPSSQPSKHFGTVDLRTDRGTLRVLAPQQTARVLQNLATEDKYERTGISPGWRR